MLSRRRLLATTAAATAFAALPVRAVAASADAGPMNALMDAFFQENLRQNPEQATNLGLDTGKNADLKSMLRDESRAGLLARRRQAADQLARWRRIDASGLSGMDRVNYDTILYTLESRERINRFDFGGAGFGASPYVVSQQTGSYQTTPDFLDTKHRIENAADADAYLSRLEAYAAQIAGDAERMKHDAGLGVIPPDFLLDTAIAQMTEQRKAGENAMVVASMVRRAKEKNLPDRYAADARRIWRDKIAPALDGQIAQAKAMRAKATHDAGIWKIDDSEAYYAAALQLATTTTMSPAEIHRMGVEQGAEIASRIDALLKSQGMTQGTVGARIKALYDDPKHFFPNTDPGKVEAIAFCNAQLEKIRPALPRVFKRLPPYTFEIRRVPKEIEPGAPLAYAQAPSLDGTRPGIVYFNFRDTREWPKWALPSVSYHEALPGHQLEGGLALSSELPLLRKTTGFSGYAEGWALYSEQLADEIGMYDDNPLGRLGYLRYQLFRAYRCVVDTGIHHMKWSREKAIAHFVDGEGDAESYARREVDRYCTIPGQACSYKIGHTVWTRARERAKKALGAKYDIREFHAAGLDCGRVPLDILDTVIDRWIKARA
jgi:uncharacterized protein (DUF885 family)